MYRVIDRKHERVIGCGCGVIQTSGRFEDIIGDADEFETLEKAQQVASGNNAIYRSYGKAADFKPERI